MRTPRSSGSDRCSTSTSSSPRTCGPWTHVDGTGTAGELHFGLIASELAIGLEQLQIDFLRQVVRQGAGEPGGPRVKRFVMCVTDGIVRARYRDGSGLASPITPGQVYEYTIDLIATSQVFKAGHRLRVDVASSNFPCFDRNGRRVNIDPVAAPANKS